MKKILIIASLEKNFASSGVGKYILGYTNLFEQHHTVSFLFQPKGHGMIVGFLRRIFILPLILKRHYKEHIKIFYDENFLFSRRPRMKKSTICIVHHYPGFVKSKTVLEGIMKPIHYLAFAYILKHIPYTVAVSKFTYEILLKKQRVDKKNTYCIENSIAEEVYKPTTKANLGKEQLALSKKYGLFPGSMLLSVAATEWRKNIPTLIELLHILPSEYYLVRVGKHIPGKEDNDINTLIKRYNLQNRYVHLTQIAENDLVKFYHCAHAFLFPSLFEGFGRPPIEAQACGCPVISTHSGSLEEVVGTSACIVTDPYNEMSYKKRIELLHDTSIRNELIKKGFENSKKYTNHCLYKKRESLFKRIENELP